MTDDRVTEIDKQLWAFGWLYNAESELFESTTESRVVIDGRISLPFVPDLSLKDLDAYADCKQQEQLRRRTVL